MTSIYDLSWSKTSFFAKLQLFFKSRKSERGKIQSKHPLIQAQGYSALSSTYYSIVGTALSKAKAKIKIRSFIRWCLSSLGWCFTWLPLGAWCYWRMLPLSNRVEELIGYEGMSTAQCDIRKSILIHWGWHEEAEKCIRIAFTKKPEDVHTQGLLHAGLAKIYQHRGDRRSAEMEVRAALIFAQKAESQDPRQAARIYRHCADITDFVKQGDPIPGRRLRRKAQSIAESVDAEDQLLKL